MAERTLTYFVSDVHLGLRTADPVEREARFVEWLKNLPRERMRSLYLLGDIWDFWYEYRDVIPREGARVVAQLISLMDEGVEVVFCPGNHDIWTYSFFASIGIRKIAQPYRFELSGKSFCVGHGDALGGADWKYRLMLKLFHNRFVQRCFSLLHPTLAFRFGTDWSDSSRRSRGGYRFRGEQEALYKFVSEYNCGPSGPVDYFIFGHYHDSADIPVKPSGRLVVLKDWIEGGTPHAVFDGDTLETVR